MGGNDTRRPPGTVGPLLAADGRAAERGAPAPGTPGAGDVGPGAAVVPDGGSVAAGAVWGALIAARDDQALSVAALAQCAGVTKADAAKALERFAAAELVLRVPRGRRAADGWMLAGGVRTGVGIGQVGLLPSVAMPDDNGSEGSSAVTGNDLPVGQFPPVRRVLKPPRLAKGELEAKVLAALRARYPQELGPLGLSREVGGYSSGAVSNCLARLHARNLIVQTCLAPKRYAALPPEAVETTPEQAA